MSNGQRILATTLAGLALLIGANPTQAQSMGSGGGGSSGGSFGGSSMGGSGSSSFGSGSGGGSSSSFLGSTTSSFLSSGTTSTNTNSTSGVGSTSFLGQNYASPTAQGLGSATSTTGTTNTTAFGSPLYNLTTTTSTSGSGSRSGGSSLGGSSSRGSTGGTGTFRSGSSNTTSTTTPVFASSAGTVRAPTYTVDLAFARPAPPPAAPMRANLQATLANSNRLTRPDQVTVDVTDGVTVLRGAVASERERNVAEAMIRLEPGVGAVRNELVVRNELALAPTP